MIQSMTAFARKNAQGDWGNAVWEIRSVNHRYLESQLRLPESKRDLDMPIRSKIANVIVRGRVEATLSFQAGESSSYELQLNQAMLHALLDTNKQIEHLTGEQQRLSSADLLKWPGMVTTFEVEQPQAKQEIMQLLQATLDELVQVRQDEGQALASLIRERLQLVRQQVVKIRDRYPKVIAEYREKLLSRLENLSIAHDEQRLEQELLFIAQKIDIDEELDRLTTHLDVVESTLQQDKTIGRRLDFLMQECNREANTLAAKSIDGTITQAAVDIKVALEQMREQIQNIA